MHKNKKCMHYNHLLKSEPFSTLNSHPYYQLSCETLNFALCSKKIIMGTEHYYLTNSITPNEWQGLQTI